MVLSCFKDVQMHWLESSMFSALRMEAEHQRTHKHTGTLISRRLSLGPLGYLILQHHLLLIYGPFQGQTFSFEFVSGSTNWDGSHTAKIDFLRPKYIWNISYKYVVNSEAHWNIYFQFSFNLHIPKYISKCISVARKCIYNLKYTAYMFTYRQVFLQMWQSVIF